MRPKAVLLSDPFRTLPAFLALAAAILMVGCSERMNPGPVCADGCGVPWPTPRRVAFELEKAWTEFNYEQYQSILSNDFTFVFAPRDIGYDTRLPIDWGRTDELLSAQHLFSQVDANHDGYVAQGASISFQIGPEIPNDLNGWTKIVLSQVFLSVSTRNKVTGDPLDYLVQGNQANLWFAKEGGAWKIIRWEDKPIGGMLAAEATTWGRIKSDFR